MAKPSLHPQLLATTDMFTVPITSPFQNVVEMESYSRQPCKSFISLTQLRFTLLHVSVALPFHWEESSRVVQMCHSGRSLPWLYKCVTVGFSVCSLNVSVCQSEVCVMSQERGFVPLCSHQMHSIGQRNCCSHM